MFKKIFFTNERIGQMIQYVSLPLKGLQLESKFCVFSVVSGSLVDVLE